MFLRTMAVVLFITAFAKLLSLFGTAKILDSKHPLLLVKYRHVLGWTALLELAVALRIWPVRRPVEGCLLVFALGSWFALYHLFVMFAVDYYVCPCLGTATQWLPISARTLDYAIKGIVAIMIAGSSLCLLSTSCCGPNEQRAMHASESTSLRRG